jgi:hypothetical protein
VPKKALAQQLDPPAQLDPIHDAAPLAVALARELVLATQRMALRPEEAAAALGISRDTFDLRVGPRLRWLRLGRIKVVPVTELQKYLDREAAVDLGARR